MYEEKYYELHFKNALRFKCMLLLLLLNAIVLGEKNLGKRGGGEERLNKKIGRDYNLIVDCCFFELL